MTRLTAPRIVMLIMLIGALALIGCGGDGGGSEPPTKAADAGSDTVEAPTPAPAEPTAEEPAEEPEEEPTEEPEVEPAKEVTEEPTAEPSAEATAEPTAMVEEPPTSQVKTVNLSQLSSGQMEQLSYVSGGASYVHHYGQAEECLLAENGGLSLAVGGVFSTREQYKSVPWWGTKEAPCKDQLEFGDMIYFVAQGYPAGEMVTFTASGPQGDEASYGFVESVIKADSFSKEEYPAARFTWIPSPALGAGDYTITASGAGGAVSMPVTVHDNLGPNFGVKFGVDEYHPLLLTPGETIQMVLSGFPPDHLVSVVLYKGAISVSNLEVEPGHDIPEDVDEPVGALEIQVNEEGYALAELEWPSDLPSGTYSFLVPELVRPDDYESDAGIYSPSVGPALYSTQFAYGGPDARWCTPSCYVMDLQVQGAEEPVNGWNVSEVLFDEGNGLVGSFTQIDELVWVETNSGGEYVYREDFRDEWSVYLIDESRNVRIQLDLWLDEIIYSDENNSFTLYTVTEAR